ncbi:MAG: AAA family ATPase [Candidatus Omnitrophota bacterium]
MRIISVTNQKGGCGKTTTAINLSAALAANNRKVLLIDLDPQAHATLGLNVETDLSIYNVLSKLTNKKAELKSIIQNIDTNFDIAPSSIVLGTIEQELAGEIGRECRLWDVLNNFKSEYDYIIIDCPPNLGILTINAIRASKEIIIPVEASRFSLEGLSQLISIVNLVRDRLKHFVNFRVLVVNFDSRLRHSFKMLDWIKSDFKEKLFSNIIHVNVKLKEAQNHGAHIFHFDKYCRGAKDYFSLSRELIVQEKDLKIPEAKEQEVKIQELTKPQEAKKALPLAVPSEISAALETKMKEILKEKMPLFNEVVFSLPAPEAKEVYLVGDFNNWQVDKMALMEKENGAWKKKMILPGGRHHYRFVVDGKWTEDSYNPMQETNPFGSMDSVIEVSVKK